jgi:hypothetical protein
MFFRHDPGPCPVDDAPHTTCCAPVTGTVIVGGAIAPATFVVVPAPASARAASDVLPPATPSAPVPSIDTPSALTTATYRGRKKGIAPPTGGATSTTSRLRT